MCESALPDGFKKKAAGTNTDWDNGIQKYWNKAWFAYGPRDKHWYHRWREMPIVLFALFGKGDSRWETSGGELKVRSPNVPILWFRPWNFYLSRIQYWCRWHVQLQWPLFFSCHFYWKAKSVPPYTSDTDTDGKLFYFYIGAHRDADKVYWFPSFYMGFNWK